ncbi:MAG: DeoR/GlpR family DNA-binding transcription regulator [Treponema sp.]|jgi:DeoR/GlpR family transcriptional regulator of sugar metabolism|nr:DeoR/GlpR family DNA-binding transcription regulator [Treponema sp.]
MTNRHNKILNVLTKSQKVEVAALAEMLGVSQVTIRKDLDSLERQALVRREHGYACVDLTNGVGKCMAYNYDVKKRIALRAAETVQDGETVFIESDSICALLAEELVNTRKDVTIVTNSVFITNHISHAPNGKIILLGGYFEKDAQVTVGPMTSKCAEVFFSDKFFIGVDGFSETFGFTGRDHLRAETIQSLASQVKDIIVLAESETFSKSGVVELVHADKVATVYTDDEIPQDVELYLQGRDVDIQKIPRNAE